MPQKQPHLCQDRLLSFLPILVILGPFNLEDAKFCHAPAKYCTVSGLTRQTAIIIRLGQAVKALQESAGDNRHRRFIIDAPRIDSRLFTDSIRTSSF